MEHELKIRPEFLQRIKSGTKTFEIRKNDRDFQVGDTLLLKEFNPAKGWPDHGVYDALLVEVVYITSFEQKDEYVVMGIREVQS